MDTENTILGWIYREIDLNQITAPLWIDTFQPSESYDWILHRIEAGYNSDSEDPSDFDSIRWAWGIPPRDQLLQDLSDQKPRPPISLCISPGINDLTAGTTRPKEMFFPSPVINWVLQPLENFQFQIENHTALTGYIRVLYMGSYVMPEPVINQYA